MRGTTGNDGRKNPNDAADLLRAYFDEVMELNPSMRSMLAGDRRFDGYRENALSPEHRKKMRALMTRYAKMVIKSDRVPMTVENATLAWIVRDGLEGYEFPFHLMPMSAFDNPPIEFAFLQCDTYPEDDKVTNLIERHKSFCAELDQAMENMHIGARRGITIPRMACLDMLHDLKYFVRHERYKLPRRKGIQSDARWRRFTTDVYGPKLARLIAFVEDEYLPKCRDGDDVGLCGIGRIGRDMYAYLVRSATTLDDATPESVHEIGLREVKRLSARLLRYATPSGQPGEERRGREGNKSLAELCAEMKRRHAFKSREAVMSAFLRARDEVRRTVLPRYFHVTPSDVEPYEIRDSPSDRDTRSVGAFYVPGDDSDRPGAVYIEMSHPADLAKYHVMALTYHEGWPGHHYQFQRMQELGLPLHKRYALASQSFVEGWALYAETLRPDDMDPLDEFGFLTYEMFRATRLVVDTGIHWYGWSFEKAVDYMARYLALSDETIRAEVMRYVCYPAQALCYKMGQLYFQSLRREVMKGNKMDIRDFHDRLFQHGVVPLCVLPMIFRGRRSGRATKQEIKKKEEDKKK